MVRFAVNVRGVVQGVGFRPFVYGVATACGLSGWVKNHTDGLRIEIQGPQAAVRDFVAMLSRVPPPGAHLDRLEIDEIPPFSESGFHPQQRHGCTDRADTAAGPRYLPRMYQ